MRICTALDPYDGADPPLRDGKPTGGFGYEFCVCRDEKMI